MNVLILFYNVRLKTSVNQCGRDQETYQSALPAEIWYQELLIMTNREVCVTIINVTPKHALKYFVTLILYTD